MRIAVWILAGLLGLLLLVVGVASWFALSPSGTSTALSLASRAVGDSLVIGGTEGTLRGPLVLRDVTWRDPASGTSVRVARATIDIDWARLRARVLRIATLRVEGVDVGLGTAVVAETEPPPRPEPPSFEAPIDIEVERFELERAVVHRGAEELVTIERLGFAAAWTSAQFSIRDLAVASSLADAELNATIGIDGGALDIGELIAQRLDAPGRVQAEGRIEFGAGSALDWRMQAAATNFDPGMFAPDWSGDLAFDVASEGRMTERGPSGSLLLRRLDGTLRERPVSGHGELTLSADRRLVGDMEITSGTSRVRVSGQGADDAPVGELSADGAELDARVELDVRALDDWLPDAAGQLTGRFDIRGAWPALAIDGAVQGAGLRYGTFAAGTVDARIDMTQPLDPSGRAQVEIRDGHVGEYAIPQLRAVAEGSIEQFAVEANFDVALEQGRAAVSTAFAGSPREITVSRLRVEQAAGLLAATGRVVLEPHLEWQIDAEATNFDPGVFAPDWSGDLEFDVTSAGRMSDRGPSGSLLLRRLDGTLRGHAVSGHGDLRLSADRRLDGAIELASGTSRLRLNGEGSDDAAAGGLDAIIDIDVLALEDWLPDAEGRLAADFTVRGAWPALVVDGTMQGADLRYGTLAAEKVDVRVDMSEPLDPSGSARVEIRNARVGEQAIEELVAEAEGNALAHALRLDVRSELAAMALRVGGALEESNWSGSIDGLTIDVPDITRLELVEPAPLSYADGVFALDPLCLEDDPLRVCLEALREADGFLQASYELRELPLRMLAAAAPAAAGFELAGTIDGRGVVRSRPAAGASDVDGEGGTDGEEGAATLEIDGELYASDVAATIADLGIELRNGSARVVPTAGGGLGISGGIESGDGRIDFEGTWSRAGELRMTANGENFLAANLPAARVIAAPDLEFSRTAAGAMRLTGQVTIPTAKIDLQKLPQGAPRQPSPDVVVVDDETPDEAAGTLPLSARIDVILGNDIKLVGFGLEAALAGRLTVQEQPGEPPTGSGQIDISGRYEAYGQDLTIRRGQILFAGTPLDNPRLDIVAVRRIDEVTAGVRIAGTAQRPQLSVFSEPPMGEANALSWLVAGRPLDQIGTGDGDADAMQAAARSLGTAAGGLLAGRLGQRLGVDTASVEDNEMIGGAAFTVGQYLSPRLYLSYGVGLFESGEVISLLYRLTDELGLKIQRGSTESRAGLEYRIER